MQISCVHSRRQMFDKLEVQPNKAAHAHTERDPLLTNMIKYHRYYVLFN